MRPILVTASALAIMLSAAACSGASDANEVAAYDATSDGYETRTEGDMASTYDRDNTMYGDNQNVVTTGAEMDSRPAFMLASDEVKASKLIGADVKNAAGDNYAKVSDVWMGENGAEPMLILEEGGIMGVGAQRYTVSFDQVTVNAATNRNDSPNLVFQTAGDTLENLPQFEENGVNEYRLASEMMGKTADFSLRDESARVDDLIFSTSGEARYAVISPGMLSSNSVVIDADSITRAQGDSDGELVITVSEDVFAQAKAYRDR
ncbi:MAG: PRC-barrel domain-containing protein [Hyphomonas sp.]